jgi:hypothetical protein
MNAQDFAKLGLRIGDTVEVEVMLLRDERPSLLHPPVGAPTRPPPPQKRRMKAAITQIRPADLTIRLENEQSTELMIDYKQILSWSMTHQ